MSTTSKTEFRLGAPIPVGRHSLADGEAGDLAQLLDVERLSQPSPWSEAVFAREFELDYSRVWVAQENARVVGFLVFWVIYDEAHILNVAVRPESRRQGLAHVFIQTLIDRAKVGDLTTITLEVRVGNAAAIALYEGFGFRVIGHRPRYYADNGEDAAVMALVLDVEHG